MKVQSCKIDPNKARISMRTWRPWLRSLVTQKQGMRILKMTDWVSRWFVLEERASFVLYVTEMMEKSKAKTQLLIRLK